MGCSSGKLMDEIHDAELTYNEFADIKHKVGHLIDDDYDLIERVQKLKKRGILLTSENSHLWKTYLTWIKEQPNFKSYDKPQ